MAISDDLPGIEVAITVDEADLKEYRDPDLDEDERTTTRYIEATSGQAFAIRIKVSRKFKFAGDTLAFRIRVDGRKVGYPLVSSYRCRFASYELVERGCRVSETKTRRFEFSSLETGRLLPNWLACFSLADATSSQRWPHAQRRTQTTGTPRDNYGRSRAAQEVRIEQSRIQAPRCKRDRSRF